MNVSTFFKVEANNKRNCNEVEMIELLDNSKLAIAAV